MDKEKVDEVLKYCYPHTDQMWAASVVGILLECDFKDAKIELGRYLMRQVVDKKAEEMEAAMEKMAEALDKISDVDDDGMGGYIIDTANDALDAYRKAMR